MYPACPGKTEEGRDCNKKVCLAPLLGWSTLVDPDCVVFSPGFWYSVVIMHPPSSRHNLTTIARAHPRSNPSLSHQVTEDSGQWRCERCSRSFPNCRWRYIFSMNVADHTGSNWLSVFDEFGEALLGISAGDLHSMQVSPWLWWLGVWSWRRV